MHQNWVGNSFASLASTQVVGAAGLGAFSGPFVGLGVFPAFSGLGASSGPFVGFFLFWAFCGLLGLFPAFFLASGPFLACGLLGPLPSLFLALGPFLLFPAFSGLRAFSGPFVAFCASSYPFLDLEAFSASGLLPSLFWPRPLFWASGLFLAFFGPRGLFWAFCGLAGPLPSIFRPQGLL